MVNIEELQTAITAQLAQVIDPETGVDVIHMRLIEELHADENGFVTCKFRPSSPLCPIALPLAMNILGAIRSVEGVTQQTLEIVDYVQAEELNRLIEDLIAELDR